MTNKKNEEQNHWLSFIQLFHIVQSSTIEPMNQQDLMSYVFNCLYESSKGTDIQISQSRASKILHNKAGFLQEARLIKNNGIVTEPEFKERLTEKVSLDALSKNFRPTGTYYYRSKISGEIYRQIKHAIDNELAKSQSLSRVQNSSKSFSKIPNVSQKDRFHTTLNEDLINKIDKTFKRRFPDSDFFKYNFSIYVDPERVNRSQYQFTITNDYLEGLNKGFEKAPIIMLRKIFTKQDKYMQPGHPFSRNQYMLYDIDPNIEDNAEINLVKIGDKKEKVYVDKITQQPIKNYEDVIIKPNMKAFEAIPSVPKYAFIGEITNFWLHKLSEDQVKVTFMCSILGEFSSNILFDNEDILGLKDETFYNITDETGESSKYEFIKDINWIERLSNSKG